MVASATQDLNSRRPALQMSENSSQTGFNETGSETGSSDSGINVVGLISLLVFYAAVLGIGIWAGWKQRKESKASGTSNDQVRKIGPTKQK